MRMTSDEDLELMLEAIQVELMELREAVEDVMVAHFLWEMDIL